MIPPTVRRGYQRQQDRCQNRLWANCMCKIRTVKMRKRCGLRIFHRFPPFHREGCPLTSPFSPQTLLEGPSNHPPSRGKSLATDVPVRKVLIASLNYAVQSVRRPQIDCSDCGLRAAATRQLRVAGSALGLSDPSRRSLEADERKENHPRAVAGERRDPGGEAPACRRAAVTAWQSETTLVKTGFRFQRRSSKDAPASFCSSSGSRRSLHHQPDRSACRRTSLPLPSPNLGSKSSCGTGRPGTQRPLVPGWRTPRWYRPRRHSSS